ncbi:hypothetical protein ABW21_db0202877 [Orbilia brochopaga]|nr:hypothetical protein ABW21_db0202877 [Drechslerella brochopaga]
MSFSALLNSLDVDKPTLHNKHPPEPSQSQHLSRKRRKLHNVASSTNSAIGPSCPTSRSPESRISEPARYRAIGTATIPATDTLNSYGRHFDIDNCPTKPSADPVTLDHSVLGRITISDPSCLSLPQTEATLQNSSNSISHDINTALAQYLSNTRQLILKNNEKLSKIAARKKDDPAEQIDDPDEATERRDQGFTRPKVLFILPTRNSCYEIVNTVVRLAARESQENKTRFDKEFGPNGLEELFPSSKPEDFKLFFRGNSDDMFRIGIKLTRKTIKLFSNFYDSDIIIASPLGLKAAMGGTDKSVKDIDFLSSIEFVYVDSADALLMQNWDHLESIFANLNREPVNQHGCDMFRIRQWYLDKRASSFRQTVISTAFLSPEINSLLSKHCRNHSGFIKFHDVCPGQLSTHIPQVFTSVPSSSPPSDPDTRFAHFTSVTLPYWRDNGILTKGGILIFISSYLDFVYLRNYFVKIGESIGEISEYSSASAVARARAHFKSGRHKILLYTERAHHFRRYSIGGVLHIFMYSIPANPIFYGELIGFLREGIANGKQVLEDAKAHAIFSQWDALKVERIVGTVGYDEMKTSDGNKCVDFEFP